MPEQISMLQAFILGLVEGITEFLPISSTGHLLVTSQVIGAASTSGTFEIVIQLGAIIAVVLYYWKKLWQQAKGFPGNWQARRFWFTLLVAFLPAAVVGLSLHKYIKLLLSSRELQCYVIAGTLIIGGIVLWLVDRPKSAELESKDETEPQNTNTQAEEVATAQIEEVAAPQDCVRLTFKQALWVGIAQCFSLIPGVSRSGATIVGGLLVGLSRKDATEFSFYLSIPTLGAATLYTLAKEYKELMQVGDLGSLTMGTIISFVTALLAISWLLRYVSSHDFRGFAIYRIVAGLAILAWVGLA